LTQSQKAEYDELTLNEEERNAWLCKIAEPKLQPLWYFMVSLCRLLQEADYSLSPAEAYWMGLVDEVPGSGLPSERQIVESLPSSSPASADASPSEQLPPAARSQPSPEKTETLP
jgi:hypothetical protein